MATPSFASPTARVALHRAAPLVVLGVLAGTVLLLQRQLQDYPWSRLGTDLAAIGIGPVVLAVSATVLSYLAMTGYDALALRYVDHPMPYRRYAAASFLATAFGNSLGASALVGAALRARVYSAWGLPAFAITRVAGFNLVTLSLGSAMLSAVGLAVAPPELVEALHLSRPLALGVGFGLLGVVVAYLAWCGGAKRPIGVRDWRIDRPSRRLALAQLTLSVIEWVTMAAVLYALLPAGHGIGFASFTVLFVLATTMGLLSNVPGGLGVIESVLLATLAGAVAPADLVAALVAYRLIYYLGPLALAAAGLAVLESRREQARLGGLAQRVGVLTPSVLALTVAVLGAVLVVTGQVPGATAVGLGEFAASLAGVGLLLLARGLHRRLRGAWALTLGVLVLLAIGHRTALVAAVAVLLVALLVLARGAFYRTTSVFADPRGWAWPVTAAGAVTVFLWAHEHWAGHSLDERTWLAVSAGDGTSGTVRIGLAAGVAGLVLAGTRLQTPGAATPSAIATQAELQRAEPVLARATHGNASLLWTGDKRVLFSSNGNALLMYQITGRSWVVMGDPVGDEAEFDDLLWRFLDECDRGCGRPVFYCVRDDLSDFYRRRGLALSKLGEEATIVLTGFSMTGSKRAKLRSETRASLKAGVEVDVLEPHRVVGVLAELREVSEAWLAERNAREKSFSLGAFDEDYLVRFPVAVARIEGRVVAFASLWASGGRGEVKVDLMRRVGDAPRTVMSHLFVESMTWAQGAGYVSFSLGMAPLAGLRTDGAAPYWDRIGHFLWTHGEHFYNFQGLRRFKDRFDPEWEPRYVASTGGPALPVMMLNVATLVGGGLRGMVAR